MTLPRHHLHAESSRSDRLSPTVGEPAPPPVNSVPSVPVGSPLEWTDLHPPFLVPEWRSLSADRVAAADAGRHFLVLGETGSGKTKSAIMPLIRAALAYPQAAAYEEYANAAIQAGRTVEPADDLRAGVLIIDPKHELGPFARGICEQLGVPERIVALRPGQEDAPILHLFEGQSPASLDTFETTRRIVELSDFYHRQLSTARQDAFWLNQAMVTISSLLSVDLYVYGQGGVTAVEDLWYAAQKGIVGQMMTNANVGAAPGAPPVAPLTIDPSSVQNHPLYYCRDNYVQAHATLINLASILHRDGMLNPVLAGYQRACEEAGVPAQMLLQIQNLATLASVTFGSIAAFVNSVLQELASPELARCLSLNPFEPPVARRFLSVERVMHEGGCLVYSLADNSPITDLVGRALKAKFFEFSFRRANRVRPCFYVCDEFQRFITGDRVSGEQSYLDRCRAFRGVCVLATQSLASLRYALATGGGAGLLGASDALEVLLNNTGNKLFFRNTDVSTQGWLQQVFPLPHAPNKPHVIQVRPTSTLRVGEAYYLWSSGRLGRSRIALSTPTPTATGS